MYFLREQLSKNLFFEWLFSKHAFYEETILKCMSWGSNLENVKNLKETNLKILKTKIKGKN